MKEYKIYQLEQKTTFTYNSKKYRIESDNAILSTSLNPELEEIIGEGKYYFRCSEFMGGVFQTKIPVWFNVETFVVPITIDNLKR